uniref:DNA primase n=1 Tax=Flavobacterium sp. TaxID=239 RepID=UPI00404B9AF8
MKRVIVDYAKLTNDILSLLVDKFPDGYEESDIIRFKNAQNELVEAVEVRTVDTIYLVKVSKKLVTRMDNFEDDDDDITADVDLIQPVKGLDLDEDDEDEDDKPKKKSSQEEEDDEDDDFNADDVADEDDDEEDDY